MLLRGSWEVGVCKEGEPELWTEHSGRPLWWKSRPNLKGCSVRDEEEKVHLITFFVYIVFWNRVGRALNEIYLTSPNWENNYLEPHLKYSSKITRVRDVKLCMYFIVRPRRSLLPSSDKGNHPICWPFRNIITLSKASSNSFRGVTRLMLSFTWKQQNRRIIFEVRQWSMTKEGRFLE
jgi:hypothetical protein